VRRDPGPLGRTQRPAQAVDLDRQRRLEEQRDGDAVPGRQ
jgi:hypothetical protein